MKYPTFGLVAALAATGPACPSDNSEEPDAMPAELDAAVDAAPSPSCLEAQAHSDLEWVQDEIFTKSCSAFSVCHQGAALSAGGLNLESGLSQAAMVNFDSKLFPDWKLVVPGDPANSYLMVILGAVEGPLEDGVGTMPYSNPTLCPEKLGAISRWIDSL